MKFYSSIYALILIVGYWILTSGQTHMLPNYQQIITGFFDLINVNELWIHLYLSIKLFLKGLFFTLVFSLPIVYFSLYDFVKPIPTFISKMRYLPMVGFTYYASLLFNSSGTVQTLMLTFFMSTFFITGCLSMIADIKEEEWFHAKTLGLNKWESIREVLIYGRMDYIIDILRQNLAISWMMVVSVEMIMFGNGGVGTLLKLADKWDNQGKIVVLQLLILVIAFLSDFTTNLIRKKNFRYSWS